MNRQDDQRSVPTGLRRGFSILTATALVMFASIIPIVHATPMISDAKAQSLMRKVSDAVGSYADLQAKGDVEYTYVFRDNNDFTSDISTERYLFDGEFSWGRYSVHQKFVFPGQDGVVVQGWDGTNAWTTLNGEEISDPQAVGLTQFLRKTNFYWFAMMQKLSDPGAVHEYKGTRDVNGVAYEIVEMTFDTPEDEQSDTYLLYINPGTYRVDRFLFTVVDFGLTDPVLMEVGHQRFGEIVLPVTRRYTPALSWDGDVAADAVWIDQHMTDIEFDNGFTPSDFRLDAN